MKNLVYGIGIYNEGKFKSKENGKQTKVYTTWKNMLRRCTDIEYKEKYPTYYGVTCSNEWKYFQNFAEWFNENYYNIEGQKMCLDKDILYKGNKIYSSKTCIFVPNEINSLFTKGNGSRGEFPIGVSYFKQTDKFMAQCRANGKVVKLGCFKTVEEAFFKYKQFKEQYIKEVANKYKNQIPIKLYEAMIQYTVEYDD